MHRETDILFSETGNARRRIADNTTLRTWAREVGLGPYITVNPAQRNEPVAPAVLSDTVEALMLAIWLDASKDLQAVKRAVAHMGLARIALE